MDDVAAEAQVSRATVYRYFASREELILGVMMSRMDQALDVVVRSLRAPDNARQSIPDFILKAGSLAYSGDVNEALFSPDSRSLVTSLEMTAEPIVEGLSRHLGPLLQRWQEDGQLYPELDLQDTVRWINTVAVLLLSPPWMSRTPRQKRTFLQRYLVRALCPEPATGP